MNKFIELLERKINGCDALGGLEREKAVYQSVLKDYKKQLTLTDVSQRSELLRFMEWLSTYWGIDEVIDCTKHQQIIEQYKP